MKKLFEKEVFKTPVTLEIMHRSSDNGGKSVKPKELKGINKFKTVKVRDKSLQLFIDNEFNLWYKDNAVILDCRSKIVNNEVKTNWIGDKIWFKITGLYERRNQFILDTVREISQISEAMYADNTVADNVALEDIYECILKSYLEYLKNI